MQSDLFGSGPQRTKDGAIADDAHWTPMPCARACVADLARTLRVAGHRVKSFRDPAVGGGSFARSMRLAWVGAESQVLDIWPKAPGLSLGTPTVGSYHETDVSDVCVTSTNPPYGGPDETRGRAPGDPKYVGAHHVLHALESSRLAVGMLLPLEWIGVGYVQDTLLVPHPPAYVRPLYPRPFPVLRAAAWYVWLAEHVAGSGAYTVRDPLRWRE